MPSVNDIVDIAESLEKCRVVALQDSCVAVRNRNTRCRTCIDVCPADAISIQKNVLKLSASRCVDCGLCTAACPTEALRMVDPSDSALSQLLDQAREANGGRAVVVCARMAAKQLANPSLYAQVSCLGRTTEATLLQQVAAGASQVLLVDGNCETCKYHYVSSHVDAAVAQANALVRAQGVAANIQRASEFPEDMLIEETDGMFGSTRRGFITDAAKAARDITAEAAGAAIRKELGIAEMNDIGQRLKVSEDGTLPNIAVPRHESVLNSLFELGELREAQALPGAREGLADTEDSFLLDIERPAIDTHIFGSISIDGTRCNACGMCAVFCPTSAIRRDPARKSPTAPLQLLEFSASDCVQCGLCQDVCWKKCIDLRSKVSLDQLFSFEPQVFKLV